MHRYVLFLQAQSHTLVTYNLHYLTYQTIPMSRISYSSFALVSIILASQPGQYLLKFSSLFLIQSVNDKDCIYTHPFCSYTQLNNIHIFNFIIYLHKPYKIVKGCTSNCTDFVPSHAN